MPGMDIFPQTVMENAKWMNYFKSGNLIFFSQAANLVLVFEIVSSQKGHTISGEIAFLFLSLLYRNWGKLWVT